MDDYQTPEAHEFLYLGKKHLKWTCSHISEITGDG